MTDRDSRTGAVGVQRDGNVDELVGVQSDDDSTPLVLLGHAVTAASWLDRGLVATLTGRVDRTVTGPELRSGSYEVTTRRPAPPRWCTARTGDGSRGRHPNHEVSVSRSQPAGRLG